MPINMYTFSTVLLFFNPLELQGKMSSPLQPVTFHNFPAYKKDKNYEKEIIKILLMS